MTGDRDLEAALPDPPPPRPDRRTMAIDEAIRRFDGREEGRRAPASAPTGISFRAIFARPQIAAFATVVLVGLLSLPLWLSDSDRFVQAGRQSAAVGTEEAPGPEAVPAQERSAPVAANEAPGGGEPVPVPPPAEPSVANSEGGTPTQKAARAPSPEAQPDKLPAGSAAGAGRAAPEQVFALAPPPPPPAPAAPAAARGGNEAAIVTGARPGPRRQSAALADSRRVAEATAVKAGDWNACTIDDPRQDLRACGEFADPAEPGPAGRAQAHLADGLRFAWQGDPGRAIGAFDKAIALAPDFSLAYLNRGLARWRIGDTGRALADLDKAVENAPESARGYYHRGRLHRARGEIARAEADARRAAELDPRYEGALP